MLTLEETLYCTACETDHPVDEFPLSRLDRKLVCKAKLNESMRARYANWTPEQEARKQLRQHEGTVARRKSVWEYLLIHPCVECGEDDPVVLEFDHVRGVKLGNVSELVYTSGYEKIKAEIEKCEVVCSNCHKRREAKRHGWYAAFIEVAP